MPKKKNYYISELTEKDSDAFYFGNAAYELLVNNDSPAKGTDGYLYISFYNKIECVYKFDNRLHLKRDQNSKVVLKFKFILSSNYVDGDPVLEETGYLVLYFSGTRCFRGEFYIDHNVEIGKDYYSEIEAYPQIRRI